MKNKTQSQPPTVTEDFIRGLRKEAEQVRHEYLKLRDDTLDELPEPQLGPGPLFPAAEQLPLSDAPPPRLTWGPEFLMSDQRVLQLHARRRQPTVWDYVRAYLLNYDHACASGWLAVVALCEVIGTALRYEVTPTGSGPVGWATTWRARFLILALPIEVIGVGVARAFQNKRYADANLEPTEAGRDSKLRTAASTIRSAKSIFSPRRLKVFTREGLKITDGMKLFWQAVVIKAPLANHQPPTLSQFRELLREMAKLEKRREPVYIILLLVFWAGLRAKEAMSARNRWRGDSLEIPKLVIGGEEDFAAKNGRTRSVAVLPWVLPRLGRLAGSREYLVSDCKREREAAYGEALHLLQEIGIEDSKAIHGGRRVYSTNIVHLKGLVLGARSTGHGTIDVLMRHYFLKPIGPDFIKLWRKGPDAFR